MSTALPGREWSKRALSIARWLFTPVAIAFLVIAAIASRDAFVGVAAEAAWPGLLAAGVAWASLHFLSPLFATIVLRAYGASVSYRHALAIHVDRLPARYLPGGIWHTVSRVADLHAHGVTRGQLGALVAWENALPLATALALGGGFLLAAGTHPPLAAACIAAGLVLFLALPKLVAVRVLAGASIRGARDVLRLAGVNLVFWLVAASGFAMYWLAFPELHASLPLVQVYAAYLLGWAAGFVAVFAPQGLGVFEAVGGLLLRGPLPLGGLAVLLAGFRIVILAADMATYASFVLLRRLRRTTGSAH